MRKSKLFAALCAGACFVSFSSGAFAEICYPVGGSVNTMNVNATNQVGTISVALSDQGGAEVFNKTGALVGTITEVSMFGTTLSHIANLPGNHFVTESDKAVLVDPFVRKFDAEGQPCSFFISETISSIPSGTGLFSNVTSVNIQADGFIAFCTFAVSVRRRRPTE